METKRHQFKRFTPKPETKPLDPNKPTLRSIREARGMKQADAAHAVGVARDVWHQWEHGRYRPSWTRLPQLYEVFGKEQVRAALDL